MKILATISLVTLSAAVALAATTSFDGDGVLSWYEAMGSGACGVDIDTSLGMFAAAPGSLWTTRNPKKDPLCKKSIQITANGKSIKVPIKDKCSPCADNQVALSRAAFLKLVPSDRGVIDKASWSIVK